MREQQRTVEVGEEYDMVIIMDKHPAEELSSWDLHLERLAALEDDEYEYDIDMMIELDQYEDGHRQLKHHHKKKHRHHHHHDDDDDEDDSNNDNMTNITVSNETTTNVIKKRHKWAQKRLVKKKPKKHKHIPKPDGTTTHGIMIDAGSQGTRIHLYEFERRVLSTKREVLQVMGGMKLSLPTTNSRWTNRLKPGLDTLMEVSEDDATLEEKVAAYLEPHMDFAKSVLIDKQDEWDQFPIFLKATGGLRTLPTVDRVRLIDAVRTVFHNDTFNPFNFVDERARVISGEEEAIYGWAGINFIKGTLVEQTEGTGTVLNPKKTYGMLEMGGASTQIGFFENNGDVMANLFKLQIGAARHWNVYVHSFLYFGVNGAWSRLNAQLYNNGRGTTVNPCLPAGSMAAFQSWIHLDDDGMRYLPRSDPRSVPYSVNMINDKPDVAECSRLTRLLLRKETNKEWVNFSHDGDCSFAGVYQPPLPTDNTQVDEFIATANYAKVWGFLQLPERSTVQSVGDAAARICAMTTPELVGYNAGLPSPIDDDELFQYCFRSTFVFEMLTTGYSFPLDYELEAADVINNQKLGWALGSILYEINILPWDFEGKLKIKPPKNHTRASKSLLGMEEPDTWDDESTYERYQQHVGLIGGIISMLAVFAMMSWMRERKNDPKRRGYDEIPPVAH